MASQSLSQASSNTTTAKSYATNRTDIGWKYCRRLEKNETNNVVCNYCGKIMRGGITRARQHLMGKRGNVAACNKCPKEVREELWGYEKDKKKKDSELCKRVMKNMHDLDDIMDLGDSDEEHALDEGLRELAASTPSSASGRTEGALKGLVDLYARQPKTVIARNQKEKMRQTSIREACDEEAIAKVHQYIARFWYQAGLPFNMVKLQSFHDMLAAIGSFGPHLQPPSYHEIKGPLLQKELEYTNQLMKGHKEQWAKFGCSIVLDAWIDRKQRCLINFLVNSSAGTMFIKSVDGSNFVKTGEKLFELLDSVVEEIGEEKVLQVITENGSNHGLASKMLEERRPKIYWTPCAAHCINLMLEDIGNLPNIKKTVQRGISLVGFIYGHSSTLSLMRCFTNKRELMRHTVNQFAKSFLTLERLHQEKSNLRKMFISNEWITNKLSKEAKGREANKIVLMSSFWRNVVYILKVMAPLVRVLQLVDSERKPTMGYIYEAINKAKETIIKSFKNNESRYKEVFEIIDNRWNCQLHRPLHVAGHFLNPVFFYDNPRLEFNGEIIKGLYACIHKLAPNLEVEEKIMMELHTYKTAGGLFGTNSAISMRKAFSPAQWWRMFGASTPNLQQIAIKILSLTCSASSCERNRSIIEQIHFKKRIEHKRLHDLVYVQYNQALNRRHNLKDELDPISLNDIDECNEWLVGEMDGADDEVGNERVFEGDDALNWEDVYMVSGVGELRVYTRRQKRKKPTSGECASAPRASEIVSSTRKGKEKMVEIEKEELEFEDGNEELEEELQDIDLEDSGGEEVERYASLFDNEYDYFGEEED